MFNEDWESSSGNSSKDILLGLIETENIEFLMKRLLVLKKSASYFESYMQDRKREEENLLRSQDEELYIDKIIRKVFSTEKLSEEEEQELARSGYTWDKLKNDEDIIKALKFRISDLEYNLDDDNSRSTCVRTASFFMSFLDNDNDKWNEIKDDVIDLVNEFDFTDLMIFSKSANSYYILKELLENEKFEDNLANKIDNFSTPQMYYYLNRVCDRGDGKKDKIELVKRNRIRELNSGILNDYPEYLSKDSNYSKGLYKIRSLSNLKRFANANIPWRFYDSKEEENANAEKDREKDEEIVSCSELYKTYLEQLDKLSPIETVQYLCSNDENRFYKEETEILKEKLKNISKQGLLTIYMSFYMKDEEGSSYYYANTFLDDVFIHNGIISKDTGIINASDEEKEQAKQLVELYDNLYEFKYGIMFDWCKVDIPTNMVETEYDDVDTEEKLLQNYVDVKNTINEELAFVDGANTLEKCTDFQLINIINKMNVKEQDKNKKQEKSLLTQRKEWLDTYFESRILAMDPMAASCLEVKGTGKYDQYIVAAVDQAEFDTSKNKQQENQNERKELE